MRRSMSYLLLLFISLFVIGLTSNQSFAQDILQKGIAEYNAENYEESLEIFKEARQKFPDSSTAAYYLGLSYEKAGKDTEAIEQLKASVNMKPVEKKAYTKLTEMLYGLNKAGDAKSYLAMAEDDGGVSPSELALMKGLIDLMGDENSDAIAAFNNAKELDRSLTQKADYYIGVAYAQDENFNEAKASLNAAAAIDPDSETAYDAREQVISLADMQERMKKWEFMIGAAVQYDDNVVTNPSTEIPGVEDISGEEDISIIAIFDAKYKRELKGPWFLNAGYRLYANNYSESRSHNLMVQRLSLTPGYTLQTGNISLPIEFQHIFLDEDEYAYLASINPAIKFTLDTGHIGEFTLGYVHRDMLGHISSNDNDRDGDIYSAGIGYFHPTFDGMGLFKAGYELSKDSTEGVNWNNIGNKLNIGALIPIRDNVGLTLAYDVFLQRYEKVDDTKRRDRTYSGSANVKWEVKKDINLNFQYAHTTADSSVAIYDYLRNTYTTAIEYTF